MQLLLLLPMQENYSTYKMQEAIIVFQNTRSAIIGERKLLDAGITVKVMPTPKEVGPACGIALRVPKTDIEKSLLLLSDLKARVL